MKSHSQSNIPQRSQSAIATTRSASAGAKPPVEPVVLSNSTPVVISPHYQERLRQARVSFNFAIGLMATGAVFGAVFTYLGNVPAGAATTSVGVIGAVSASAFKLSKDANDRLDKTALEEDEP